VKYECLKELMQKFLTFTSENKTHFSFYKWCAKNGFNAQKSCTKTYKRKH
jgi:hypothetical protein